MFLVPCRACLGHLMGVFQLSELLLMQFPVLLGTGLILLLDGREVLFDVFRSGILQVLFKQCLPCISHGSLGFMRDPLELFSQLLDGRRLIR